MKTLRILFAVCTFALGACSNDKSSGSGLPIRGEASRLITPQQSSPVPIQDVFAQLSKDFTTTMLQCPEKIWPNYTWKNYNVLMLDQAHPPLLWKGSTGKTEQVSNSDFPADNYQGLYNFFEWDKSPALSIFPLYAGDTSFATTPQIFKLAIHEGFHNHGQEGWTSKGGSRGTDYPLDAKPRIYRRHLYNRLNDYFMSKGQNKAAFEQAAFWYNKWITEYSSEVDSTTDGYEGTAKYVDTMASLIVSTGCGVTDSELLDAALAYLPTQNLVGHLSPKNADLDGEGYAVGSISGFVLTLIEKNTTWYDEMKTGKTPLEVLLTDAPSTPDTTDPVLENEFAQITAQKNTELEKLFGKELAAYSQQETVRIAILGGMASFSPIGFYLPKALPNVTIIPLAFELPMTVSDGSTLNIQAKTVLFSQDKTACTKPSMFIATVPKSAVNYTEGKLVLNSHGLVGNYPSTAVIDADGITWYCPL